MQFSLIAGVFFVLSVVSAAPTLEELNDKCDVHHHINLHRVMHGIEDPVADAKDDIKFTMCMYQGLGLQNEKGDINVDNMRNVFGKTLGDDAARVNEIVTKCGKRAPGTPEEATFALQQCLMKIRESDE